MEIGVTVGTVIDRLEATAADFSFAEFGLAEAAEDQKRCRQPISPCSARNVRIRSVVRSWPAGER
jgi:hypothetical protein